MRKKSKLPGFEALFSFAAMLGGQISSVPANELIQVRGRLRLIHAYGPPGYGEDPKHDSHVTYLALVLPKPLHISNASQQDFDCTPTKQMHVFFHDDDLQVLEKRARLLLNREVMISGKVQCADSAGEMTTLYLDADAVTALAPAKEYYLPVSSLSIASQRSP